MGESRSAAQLAAKCGAAAVTLGAVNKKGVAAAALVVKQGVIVSGAAATGGDGRFSHWRWKKGGGYRPSPALSAGYEVKGGAEFAEALVRARPVGIWRVAEDGAQAHTIRPRGRGRGRGRGRRVIRYGDGEGDVAASVNHPGAKGKKAWTKGTDAAVPLAVAQYRKEQVAALRSVF